MVIYVTVVIIGSDGGKSGRDSSIVMVARMAFVVVNEVVVVTQLETAVVETMMVLLIEVAVDGLTMVAVVVIEVVAGEEAASVKVNSEAN